MVGFSELKKRTRTANPQGKTRPRTKKSGSTNARQRNPDLLTLGALVNPQGAKKHMASKKGKPKPKTSTTPAAKSTKKKNRFTNPHQAAPGPRFRRKHRTGNPNLTNRTLALLKNGAFALGGLVATRQLPQMVLQGENKGYIGYLANAAVALGSGVLAESLMRGSGAPVMIGGGLYVVERILSEKFSSAGQILSLSGAGDSRVAVNGTRGLRGIRQGYFPLPVQYDNAGQPIIPQAIIAAAQAGMVSQAAVAAAAASPGMRGPGYPNRASGNRLIAA